MASKGVIVEINKILMKIWPKTCIQKKTHLRYVTTWANLKVLLQKRIPRIRVPSSSTLTQNLVMEITFKNEFRCWKKIPNFNNEVLAEYLNNLWTRRSSFESDDFQHGDLLIGNMEKLLTKKKIHRDNLYFELIPILVMQHTRTFIGHLRVCLQLLRPCLLYF